MHLSVVHFLLRNRKKKKNRNFFLLGFQIDFFRFVAAFMDMTQRLRKTIIIAEDDLTTDPVFANNRLRNGVKKKNSKRNALFNERVRYASVHFKEIQNEN